MRGGGSINFKPTCSTCEKKHIGKCLAGTNGCYGCVNNYEKVINCPTLVSRGREAKQYPSSGLVVGEPKRNHFYWLQANKEANLDEGDGKLYFPLMCSDGFFLSRGVWWLVWLMDFVSYILFYSSLRIRTS